MNPEANAFKINAYGNSISFKLVPNPSKDAIKISGRHYSIEFGNDKNIFLIKHAVLEVYARSFITYEKATHS